MGQTKLDLILIVLAVRAVVTLAFVSVVVGDIHLIRLSYTEHSRNTTSMTGDIFHFYKFAVIVSITLFSYKIKTHLIMKYCVV